MYFRHEVKRSDCALCPDRFRLELHRYIGMLIMVEKGIYGGITQSVKRLTRQTIIVYKTKLVLITNIDIFNVRMKTTLMCGQ